MTLVIGIFAGLTGSAQPAKTDTFVLHFAFDHSEVRSEDTSALGRFLADRSIDSITVTGHTDTVGGPEYNLRLSQRRAAAAGALVQHLLATDPGVPVRLEARGETEPLPGDDSESRRAIIVCWRRPPPPPALPPVVAKRDTPENVSEPDTVIRLDDIRFHANTTNLTESAQLILPKYISYLLTLKDRYLEIDGYCNSPGPLLKSTDVLYILSIKRAKVIYDRLVEQGFDPGRLIYKGKGNANPRNAHPTTRDEMDKNMRVEIRVFRVRPEEP